MDSQFVQVCIALLFQYVQIKKLLFEQFGKLPHTCQFYAFCIL